MTIDEIREKIDPILKAHDISYAAVFGSVARGEARPESDVDLLVRPGRSTDLFEYFDLREELAAALGREVDVVTEKNLSKYFRSTVLTELKTVYGSR